MKRKLLLMLLCAALGLGAAQAEVYRVENEKDVPADWAEKDTLRLTCIDTNRSDAMVLQSGGEAMMVDGGEGRYRKRVYATLDGYGITELKYLLNTHCDDDHLHGFIYLMYSDLYQVDAFLSPNTTTYGEKLRCDILKAPHHGLATIPDSFVEQTQPQVLFVPNRSALSTKVTAGWVKNHMPGAALYFSGDGTVTMLTDGTDWYIWQEPNYVDPQ